MAGLITTVTIMAMICRSGRRCLAPTGNVNRISSCLTRSIPTICALPPLRGFNTAEQFYTYLKDSFDVLYAEGETSPKNDVYRHALPVAGPPRTLSRSATFFLITCSSMSACGFVPASRLPTTGGRCIRTSHSGRPIAPLFVGWRLTPYPTYGPCGLPLIYSP